MKYILKNIPVPDEVSDRLNKINLFIYNSDIDINDYLANLFVSEEFCKSVFHKVLTNDDWQRIYYSLNSTIGKKYFKNNGILFEHFSNKILSEQFNLKNLINIGELDLEDPSKGVDIIFLDEQFKLQFYEVKSRCTRRNNGTQNDFVELVKDAIISLFCKEMKTVSKLMDAKNSMPKNDELFNSYKLLQEILKDTNMIKYVDNSNLNFNICIIGEKINIDDEKLKCGIIEVFNTTKYCLPSCKRDSIFCPKKVLDKIYILNIVNIQFLGELSLNDLYIKIMNRISEKGVLDE